MRGQTGCGLKTAARQAVGLALGAPRLQAMRGFPPVERQGQGLLALVPMGPSLGAFQERPSKEIWQSWLQPICWTRGLQASRSTGSGGPPRIAPRCGPGGL